MPGFGTIFDIIKDMKEIVKILANHDFIISNYATKLELLKLKNTYPWLKTKILSDDEFISLFLGRVNEDTLIELINKYNFDLEHARIIYENLIFIKYSNKTLKTKELSSYRKALINDQFIKIDSYASYAFAGKNILLSSYLKNHPVIMELLSDVKVKIQVLPLDGSYSPKVVKYKTSIEEIYDVLNNISSLIAQGISVNDIKLVKPSSEYLSLIRHLAPQFGLLFQNNPLPLITYPEIQDLFNALLSGQKTLKEITESNEENTSVFNAFLNMISVLDLDKIPESSRLEYLRYKLSTTTVNLIENDGIEIIDELPDFSVDEKHYFYLNFAQGVAPLIESSSRLLTSRECKELGVLTSADKAIINEEKLKTSIKNIQNLHLSFAEIFSNQKFEISPLVSSLNLAVIRNEPPTIIYSSQYLNYIYGLSRDDFRNYNYLSEDLVRLHAFNPNVNSYSMFDYRFKGINYSHKLPLKLSFSSIDTYNKLPFDYFVQYLLGIKDDRPNFNLDYGNIIHQVFEHSTDLTSFNYNFYYFLDQSNLSVKDRFFVEHTKPIIEEAYKFYLDYVEVSKPSQILKEQKASIILSDDISLVGKLDRIHLYDEGDNKEAVIIDFKTGKINYNEKFFEDGLYLQLPIYGLLLKEDDYLKGHEVGALVLNSFKVGNYALQSEDVLKEEMRLSIRFKGIVNDNENVLKRIDPTYLSSEFYRGVKMTKDMRLKGTHSNEEIDNFISTAKREVLKAGQNIIANDFAVRTIKLSKTSNTGQQSEYKRISYLPGTLSGDGDYDGE